MQLRDVSAATRIYIHPSKFTFSSVSLFSWRLIYLSFHLSIHLYVYLSFHKHIYLSICIFFFYWCIHIYQTIYTICIIPGKNSKIQKILGDEVNFSFDFGLILTILLRFLPLCIVLSPITTAASCQDADFLPGDIYLYICAYA